MNDLPAHLVARVRELAVRQVNVRLAFAERLWATFPVIPQTRFPWMSRGVYNAYCACRSQSAYAFQELAMLTAALYWEEKEWTPADPYWIEYLERQCEANTYDSDYLYFYGGK